MKDRPTMTLFLDDVNLDQFQKTTPIYAVGGVGPDNFADWVGAGATGFGIGSSLYKPGMSLADIRAKVQDITAAYDAVFDR